MKKKRSRPYRAQPRPAAQPGPAPVSDLARKLMEEAEREDREAERRKAWDDGPKPRAIRKYERYSNMGD